MAKKQVNTEVENNELTVHNENESTLVVINEDYMAELEANAGSGLEDIGFEDLAIPLIYLLQSLSPEVDEEGAGYIHGAKPGMAMNNVTNEIYDIRKSGKPLLVIPVGFYKEVVEWGDRESGGGYIARHDKDTPLLLECYKNSKGQMAHKTTGNIFVSTSNHAVLLSTSNDEWHFAIIPMASTKQKASRKWNNLVTTVKATNSRGEKFTPPMFACEYLLSSVTEENSKGKFSNFDISFNKVIEDYNLYKLALNAHKDFKRGLNKVATPVYEGDVVDNDTY